MKKLITKVLLVVALFGFGQIFAQTETNVAALNQLSAEFDAQWKANQIKVQQYATEHNVPIYQELEDGRTMQIVDIQDGKPVFYITHNLGAAKTTRASEIWPGGSSGINISGAGYDQLGEWDAGHVRKSHQEFTDQGASRATPMDGN